MIRNTRIISLSTIGAFSLILFGCGGSSSPSTTALSLAGTTNQYYNQSYTYRATFSNLGSTQGTGITNCTLNISGDASAYLQIVSTQTTANQCIFTVKDSNTTNTNLLASLSATATYNNQSYQSGNNLQVEAYSIQVNPPQPGTTNYWRLNFPSGTPLPSYVYQGQKLIAYVESLAQPVFLMPTNTNGSFQIITPNGNGTYRGCQLTMSQSNNVSGSCPGISTPQLSGNELNVSYAAGTLPSITPQVTPTPPTYPPRQIVFMNNLTLPVTIKVTGAGQTSSFTVNAQSSYNYAIPDAGLTSYNFQISSINTRNVSDGTYGEYATLLEITYPALTDIHNQANIDVSMVNGYNTRYNFYPQAGTYFTYDFALGNTTQAVSYFDEQIPASTLNPLNISLEQLCQTIDSGMKAQQSQFNSTNFVATSSSSFAGCYSPRSVASVAFGPTSDIFNQYGCVGNYGTPATCTTGANSSYVSNIHANAFRGYAYPYDDWFADYSADRHTSLVFEILSAPNGLAN